MYESIHSFESLKEHQEASHACLHVRDKTRGPHGEQPLCCTVSFQENQPTRGFSGKTRSNQVLPAVRCSLRSQIRTESHHRNYSQGRFKTENDVDEIDYELWERRT